MVMRFYPKKLQQKLKNNDIKQFLMDKGKESSDNNEQDSNFVQMPNEDEIKARKKEMDMEDENELKEQNKKDSAIGRKRDHLISSIS